MFYGSRENPSSRGGRGVWLAATVATYSEIEAVFAEAVSLPAAERGFFLDGRCADPALRAEVEALLRADANAAGFMDEKGGGLAGEAMMLGPYTLVEEIGRGGFSTVWRARQERPVCREVAVKRIAPGMDSAHVLRRFEQERQTLALMDHPAIARIFDAGADGHGRPFFVMELVRGRALSQWVKEKALAREDRLALFLSVCAAVTHAHQRGIIHRDLKPANILVDEAGPKIIDFGIARLLEMPPSEPALTREGQIVGTPAYMAPELMEGKPADTRADVFSLGVVLCELLTGRPPRDPETFEVTPVMAWRELVGQKPARWPRLHNDLDAILAHALESDPARRYGSVAELAQDVEAFRAGRPVQARPPTRLYLVRRFVGRHRVGVAALFIALLGLTAGGAAAWRQKWLADEARARAEKEARDAREAFLGIQRLIIFTNPVDGHRSDMTLGELLETLADDFPAYLKANPRLEFESRYAIGMSLLGRDLLGKAEPHLRRAHALALQEFGPGDDRTGQLNLGLASLFSMAYRDTEAIGMASEAQRIFSKTRGPQADYTLRARGIIVRALTAQGKWEQAESEARLLIADAEAAQAPVAPRASWSLGRILVRQGRFEEAEKAARHYLETQAALTGPDSLDAWDAQRFLGEVLNRQGRHEEAAAILRETLRRQQAHYGPGHLIPRSTAEDLERAENGLKK